MRENDLQKVMNLYTQDFIVINSYSVTIDNKHEIQISKAIDVVCTKSRLVESFMLLVYILVGYQINMTAY